MVAPGGSLQCCLSRGVSMYLRDVWGVCVRRWYLGIAALVLTVAGCVGLAALVPPSYNVQAYVVLVPPPSTLDPSANRLLGLGGLDGSVAILERSMRSDETSKELERTGGDATYEVAEDFTTSAPILLVTSTATTKAASSRMLDAVLERLPIRLRNLQVDVDIRPANQITLSVVSQDLEPKANQKSRIRAVAGGAAVMLTALTLLIAMVDGLLLRRARTEVPGEPTARPTPPKPLAPPPRKQRDPGPGNRSAGDRIGV